MKEKWKGGRPPLADPEDKKTERIVIRFSKREKADLKNLAKFKNSTLVEFLRNLAYEELGVFVKTKPNSDTQELRKEFRKLAINVNQLTAKANSQNFPKESILLLDELAKKLFEKIEEL